MTDFSVRLFWGTFGIRVFLDISNLIDEIDIISVEFTFYAVRCAISFHVVSTKFVFHVRIYTVFKKTVDKASYCSRPLPLNRKTRPCRKRILTYSLKYVFIECACSYTFVNVLKRGM